MFEGRHSLVVKHCLGKTETVSPILTDGSIDRAEVFVIYNQCALSCFG